MKVLPKIFYIIGIVLLVCFLASSGYYYYNYYAGKNYQYHSSPLYVYILVQGITFLVPSIISFVIACILKRKGKSSNGKQ